ncbi:MAG: hypothetical protein P9M14_08280 [Candidatus Alcyoniella australis]|nr:hypothetical protein [Candidatus Alcyoniella australis]
MLDFNAIAMPLVLRIPFIALFVIALVVAAARRKSLGKAAILLFIGLGMALLSELTVIVQHLVWIMLFHYSELSYVDPMQLIHRALTGLSMLLHLGAWIMVVWGALAGREARVDPGQIPLPGGGLADDQPV